jgi:hypothetical protein
MTIQFNRPGEITANDVASVGRYVTPAPDVAIAGPITGFKVKKGRKHSHYYKACPFDEIDFYRIVLLFGITDPCVQHALKKLLVVGGRGSKDADQDVQDVIDTMERWKEMRAEEENARMFAEVAHTQQ